MPRSEPLLLPWPPGRRKQPWPLALSLAAGGVMLPAAGLLLGGGCTIDGDARDELPASSAADGGIGANGGGGEAGGSPDDALDAGPLDAPSLFALDTQGSELRDGCYPCIRERCADAMLSCDLGDACRVQGACAILKSFSSPTRDLIILDINCRCGAGCLDYSIEPALLSLLDCAWGSCHDECWK